VKAKAQRLQNRAPAAFPAACGGRPLFQTVVYQRPEGLPDVPEDPKRD